MKQQSLAPSLPRQVATLSQAKPDEVLVKMLDEAERTIVARIPISPPAPRTEHTEQPQRVRYNYD